MMTRPNAPRSQPSQMVCPNCGRNAVGVIETRPYANGYAMRRRRNCFACGWRFTTREEVAELLIMEALP